MRFIYGYNILYIPSYVVLYQVISQVMRVI